MAVVASAEIELDEPVAALFARFVDYTTWASWMPSNFRPVRGPSRALRVGDRVTVRMGPGLLTPLSVLRLRPGREICWRGGIPGVLVGEHSFFFDDLGDGRTRIRSEEPFTGVLPRLGPLGRAIEREAGHTGMKMLEGFRDYVQT
jgi:hypothetical protein